MDNEDQKAHLVVVDLDALQIRIDAAELAIDNCQAASGQLTSRIAVVLEQADAQLRSISAAASNAAASADATNKGRAQAQELLAAIEDARRKADSESAYAYNAKANSEEHAKAIAQIRGGVEATVGALATTKGTVDQIALEIANLRTLSDSHAKAIAENKGTADRLTAEAQAAKDRADAVLPAIEQAAKDANAISASKAGADANTAAIQTLQTQMAEVVAKADADRNALDGTVDESEKIVAAVKTTLTTAESANGRVLQYEGQLEKLVQGFEEVRVKIEGVLPGATSAGLASAFHDQKARFSRTQPRWLGLFIASIACLVWAALWGVPASNDSWDSILRHFVNRLPIVAPLVWVAIYAGHQFNMALRLEEDYAFKEAVSRAFEGYKREMHEIPAAPGSNVTPLVTLCENVLTSLAERPGRIYDSKTDVVTPLTPIMGSLRDVVAQLKKAEPTTATEPAKP